MTKTIKGSVPGNKELSMLVSRNNFSTNEIFIRRNKAGEHAPNGIVYTPWETYQFILALAEMAELEFEPTAAGNGIILQAPENPVVTDRRDVIATEYFAKGYDILDWDHRMIVDRIVELEQKAGEL